MTKIIVHTAEHETRAAILEDDQLVEFYIEKPSEELVGNIYVGTVMNVLPGMQAAFIDIGLDKNAFLYVDDAIPPHLQENNKEASINIKEILQVGQKVIVQVQKESFGNKGPRVTTHISLPGRYLVYMPYSDYVGISRRINDEEQRTRFKELGEKIKQEEEGVIIRTLATEADEQQLLEDLQFLRGVWRTILEQSRKGPVPSLIHKDLDLVSRLVRDLLSEEVEQFIVDNGSVFRKIKELIDYLAPEFSNRLYLYTEKEPVFDALDIQKEIDKAIKRKVWLKSGGYIIIDRTEALTAIDVNTGKYIGHTHLEDTVLKTNLEAAVEIAKQLRLRDIGGIIIIDFIDMGQEDHRQKVLEVLESEMKKDRTKSNILGLTQLGLVEMTRKKVRQSLDSILLRPCPICDGVGRVISEEEISKKIEKEIRTLEDHTSVKELIIEAHPYVTSALRGQNGENIRRLEKLINKKITLLDKEMLHFHHYHIHPKID